MIIRQVEFVTSAVEVSQYPNWNLPEIAMVGRSNVGKSSLINALCRRKGIARVAAAPGKTRLVNFYTVNDALSLVDLAGYGYARVAKTTKATWGPMVESYLNEREQLRLILLLLDIRHDPTADDLLMENWLFETGRDFAVVLTKADKITRQEQNRRVSAFHQILKSGAKEAYMVSAEKSTGLEALWDRIEAATKKEEQDGC